jgi:D-glycero-D-manno-heptose 1,7-bisphosphate phosphatase
MARRAVFLDRDGVLNRGLLRDGRLVPPHGVDELEVLPGVAEALRLLAEAGFLRIVVTNQPDVTRGTQDRAAVDAINQALAQRLPLDDILTCFHDNADCCDCRKPQPGLLLRAAASHDVELARSFMVGDRAVDIDAGRAAGCTTFLVETEPPSACADAHPDHRARNLLEAAQRILSLAGPVVENSETLPR